MLLSSRRATYNLQRCRGLDLARSQSRPNSPNVSAALLWTEHHKGRTESKNLVYPETRAQ
jgi:hypothetical protein